MSYDYAVERPNLFTENGQVRFIKVRDRALELLRTAGAFRCDVIGVEWLDLACLDRMVERGELVALRAPNDCWRQYQVYASPKVHNL